MVTFQDNPHKVDVVEKVKLTVADLRPGMFVCELDRPWLETPFLLQGFELKNDADIEEVMRYCRWVYIDLLRTKVQKVTIEDVPKGFRLGRDASYQGRDLAAANSTRENTSTLIKTFIDEIRFGQCPDIQLAKAAVSDCVASIAKNPEAMLFITRLRKKDEYTSQHAFNVCVFSLVIGRLIGLGPKEMEELGTSALLCDMGKVSIPDTILNKPGKLTAEERAIIQTHTAEGRDILMTGRNIFSGCVDVAYGHHENLDGSGYPRALQGYQMNLNCKIVAITDKYDAITSKRPYRPAGDHLDAISVLNKMASLNKIDADLSTSFFTYLGIYPPGSIVELNSGELGIVIDSKPEQRLRPQLLLVRDSNKEPIQTFVDLAEKKTDEKGRPYRISTVRRPGDYDIDLTQYSDLIMQAFD